jgi:starch synthase
MENKRILHVTQEMNPYLNNSGFGDITRQLPQYLQENGFELRLLMPRFGVINERRHRLHEVVRLSGINIIINDDDYPLIIKVASLPNTRLQAYFLDNEEFFKRKAVFTNQNVELFDDNAERMIFFCKGIFETVKKFGWAPDIIHCHGWMTSLIPMYLKTAYKDDPIFNHSQVVYSAYNETLEGSISNDLVSKAQTTNVTEEHLAPYKNADIASFHKGAGQYADGIVIGNEGVHPNVISTVKESGKPILEPQQEDVLPEYYKFYQQFLQ